MSLLNRDEQATTLASAAKYWGITVTDPIVWEDKFIHINQLRLHYLDWGNKQARPMVLLHGGGQTAHSWDLTAIVLRSWYHVMALDQRGHGESEWAPDRDYSSERQADDILHFVGDLQLHKPILVGLSLGGLNGLVFAKRHSHDLAALIVVDVGPRVEFEGSQNIKKFMTNQDTFSSIDQAVTRAAQFNPLRPRDHIRFSIRHNLMQTPNGDWTWRYDKYFREPERLAERNWECITWEDIEEIKCPTLIVRGANSDVFSADTAELMAKTIPNACWVEVPRAGHTVASDNPAGFAHATIDFLDRHQLLPDSRPGLSRRNMNF